MKSYQEIEPKVSNLLRAVNQNSVKNYHLKILTL